MTPVYVVIVAGGRGTRMGAALPKQFLDLCGKPVLYHTVRAFADAVPQAQIVLVLPASQMSYAQMVLQHFEERIDIELVSGGNTRFESVKAGLARVSEDSIVMVHDGVRPLVSTELIHRCIEKTKEKGSAIPVIPATDSLRLFENNGEMSRPIDRSKVRIVQTPQTFRASLLLPAFNVDDHENFTDEATVLEQAGKQIYFVAGDKQKHKDHDAWRPHHSRRIDAAFVKWRC